MTAVLVVATVADYMAWLGWDQHKDVHPDGSLSGPYETWQVAGFVLILVALTVWVSRRGHIVLGTVVVPVVLTICFSIDPATDSENDGLWPVGAAAVLFGSALGVALVGHSTAKRPAE
jgi:hypothetical protein